MDLGFRGVGGQAAWHSQACSFRDLVLSFASLVFYPNNEHRM